MVIASVFNVISAFYSRVSKFAKVELWQHYFHPCTDGQTERMNQWIENYLREFVNGQQNNWSTLLPVTEFTHNSWRHEHTKYTPHQLILGINPTANLNIPDDSNPGAQQRLLELAKA